MKRKIYYVIGIALLVLICGVTIFLKNSSMLGSTLAESKTEIETPSEVVANYLELVSNGKIDESEKYITSHIQKKASTPTVDLPRVNWSKMFYERKIKLEKIIKENIETSESNVSTEVRFNNSKRVTKLNFSLNMTDGYWKIYSIELTD